MFDLEMKVKVMKYNIHSMNVNADSVKVMRCIFRKICISDFAYSQITYMESIIISRFARFSTLTLTFISR